uniref:Dynein regulatory complex protein 9 n=1 Tax=Strigamia maritima TaxID=126957 RepID=T1JME1_STRMM
RNLHSNTQRQSTKSFLDSIDRLHIIGRLLPVPMPSTGIRPNIPAVAFVKAAEIPNMKTKESRHELFPKHLKNEIETKASFDDDAFKLQKDRSFLEDTLQKALTEIKCNNTYNILVEAVHIESVKKAEYEAVIKREQILNQRITNLGRLLAKCKEEKEQLLWRCNDTVTQNYIHAMDAKEVALVSVVFEDSLDKLDIMNLLAPPLHHDLSLNDESEGIPTVINECHALFPADLHNPVKFEDEESLKWRIFHSGRIYLENVLKVMLDELQTNQSCDSLTSIIEKEKLSRLEEVQAELKQDIREDKLHFLKRELKNVETSRVQKIKQAEETLKYLKSVVQKTKISNIESEKYAMKHNKIRIEQAKKKLANELEDLKTKIEKLQLKMEDERRIHTEVESFRNYDYQCMENKLQYWIDKYNRETTEMEKKIRDLHVEKEKQLSIYNALVERYCEYKQVLKEDQDAKRAEGELIAFEEKKRKSVLSIQCWWRAVMVRRFLGQFRSLKKIINQRKLKAKAVAKAAKKSKK